MNVEDLTVPTCDLERVVFVFMELACRAYIPNELINLFMKCSLRPQNVLLSTPYMRMAGKCALSLGKQAIA